MKKWTTVVLLFLLSCKSTDSINQFGKSASAGLREIGRSSPGFGQFCRLYDPAVLKAELDTGLYGRSSHKVIHCPEYRIADSLTNVINQTLVTYFSLLQSVSDNKLLAYNAGDLVNSLASIQPQVLPSLNLTENKISAVKGLLNTILNEPLKCYRYKKLVSVMQQNDSLLTKVLSAYSFILDSALSGEISQAKANYTAFVYAPLFEWSRTPVEKWIINKEYNQFVSNMDLEKERIDRSVRLLRLIQKDHHMLAFGKPPAGFAFTGHEISQDIVLINKMINELIQIIQ